MLFIISRIVHFYLRLNRFSAFLFNSLLDSRCDNYINDTINQSLALFSIYLYIFILSLSLCLYRIVTATTDIAIANTSDADGIDEQFFFSTNSTIWCGMQMTPWYPISHSFNARTRTNNPIQWCNTQKKLYPIASIHENEMWNLVHIQQLPVIWVSAFFSPSMTITVKMHGFK